MPKSRLKDGGIRIAIGISLMLSAYLFGGYLPYGWRVIEVLLMGLGVIGLLVFMSGVQIILLGEEAPTSYYCPHCGDELFVGVFGVPNPGEVFNCPKCGGKISRSGW